MEPDRQALAHAQPARAKLVGTIVAAWALLDPLIGIAIVILAAWLRPKVLRVQPCRLPLGLGWRPCKGAA
jgi:hypothetical protein